MGRHLSEGDAAPDVELTDHTGQTRRLSDLRGRWVVLFFYPRDFSLVCTRQACTMRDSVPQLAAANAIVIGVSGDTDASHTRFAQQHTLPFPLVSDVDGSLARAFGVGRALLGLVPARATFVIDPNGRVAAVERSLFRGEHHARRALMAIQRER